MQRKVDGAWRAAGFEDFTRRNGRYEIGFTMKWSRAEVRVKNAATGAVSAPRTIQALVISDKPWSGTASFEYDAGYVHDGPPGYASQADDEATVTFDGTPGPTSFSQNVTATGSVDRFYGDAVGNGCTQTEKGSFTHGWAAGFMINYGQAGVTDSIDAYVGGRPPNYDLASSITWKRTCPGSVETVQDTIYDVLQVFEPGTSEAQDGICVEALKEGLWDAFQAQPRSYAHTTGGSETKTIVDDEQGLTRSCAVTWQLTRDPDADHDGVPD